MSKGKVILAYSGGLDTSVILKWLMEEGYEVIAYLADVGQKEDFEAAREKALKIGASRVYIEDLKEEFVTDYIIPSIQANALYESRYMLGTSVARPIIAKRQIEIAEKENAAFVSHGATGKGNDQVRFELGYYALKPDIQVLAPWKMPEFLDRFRGRSDMLHYAEQHGIPVTASRAKPYSEDENLLHISHEAGVLEDPNHACDEDVYSHTAAAEKAPDAAEIIKVTFENGVPVSLESEESGKKETSPLALFEFANDLAATHGIGRLDMVENRFVGIKSRGVYETPGGHLLFAALRDLEGLTMDREVMRLRDELSVKVAHSIYNGFWFSPEMTILWSMINQSMQDVTGTVRVKLYKGLAYPIARDSEIALYDEDQSSMDIEGGYNQQDAEGFIKINAIRLRQYKIAQDKLKNTAQKKKGEAA
ncbi:MAG: argininosuccinate synthase [Alphaproteobacteria bacterium]|jgi:argininosuccinate synthase|nr:argininosuccinate synthase [Alphaproteobacteria bacterium]MDP7223258.1 argininosuccinate synthase [Alphaproteobacteria bacterium]